MVNNHSSNEIFSVVKDVETGGDSFSFAPTAYLILLDSSLLSQKSGSQAFGRVLAGFLDMLAKSEMVTTQ